MCGLFVYMTWRIFVLLLLIWQVSADALEVVVRDKICCYRLIELMYNTLLKSEVFSNAAGLCKLWNTDEPAAGSKPDAWKSMTIELIRYAYIYFTLLSIYYPLVLLLFFVFIYYDLNLYYCLIVFLVIYSYFFYQFGSLCRIFSFFPWLITIGQWAGR